VRSLSSTISFRAGFCAIAGLPNVGKSTLLNQLLGQPLSIVTPKAQTTRQRLLGIYTDDSHQAVFVDTPGLLEPRYLMQERMREDAEGAMADADVLVYVVDAGFAPSLEHAARYARPVRPSEPGGPEDGTEAPYPRILCLNKMDRVNPEARLEMVARFSGAAWDAVVATVATTGEGVRALREEVLRRLPPSPPLYPPEDVAVAPMRFFVSELIRETVFELLADEVPYATAVTIEEYRDASDKPGLLFIAATIHVERESQKGIVIGAGGRMIRQVGTEARQKIEAFTGQRVYLELRAKVLRNWRRREGALKLLGLQRPG